MDKRLGASFYSRMDVLQLSKELLGAVLITDFEPERTSGIIVETEAYVGTDDKASHAFGGRKTKRTATMFDKGGLTYIYLCYGIHHLFNVVVSKEGVPNAILVRAIEPQEGIPTMLKRCKKEKMTKNLTNGPGKLSRALGITSNYSGRSLLDKESKIWIEKGILLTENEIVASPRIGVDYAGDDALLPYRFTIKGNKYISQ